MIANFNSTECRSDGCTCCSCTYDNNYDKTKILEEARENIRIVKEICKFYKIDFNNFCNKVLTQATCRKHKFVEKWPGQDACIKCGFLKPFQSKGVKI